MHYVLLDQQLEVYFDQKWEFAQNTDFLRHIVAMKQFNIGRVK